MGMLSRRGIVAGAMGIGAGLCLPSISRSQTTPSHFFAGCFYDTAMSESSMAAKHLIAPVRQSAGLDRSGAELSPMVRDIVVGQKDFGRAAALNERDEGNPVAVSLTRAQHEVVTVATPGLPTEYLTIISVSAALDVMTDQAAFRNSARFESVYCNMIVVNQVVQARSRLSDAELAAAYRRVFVAAVEELLGRAAKTLRDKRERASAVFQVKNMVLPEPLPPDLEHLVAGAVEASADVGGDARASEIVKLGREIRHVYSLMILDALDKAKVTNVAILPPDSPWSEGRVLRLLQQRLGMRSEILSQPDASRMNGYEIRAGITKVLRTKAGGNSQIDVTMGSRIVRNRDGQLEHMPAGIKDPLKKVASATGTKRYVELADFKRGVTRDVTMTSIRAAAQGTAEVLVPLIKATAADA
jgi:hypothetical protein